MSTLILLVGKSGSGKDYFVNRLGLKPVVSHTTRDIRPGEIDGREHIFVEKDQYQQPDLRGEVCIAYTYYNGHHYWATEEDLRGRDVYIIDVAGVDYFKSANINYNLSIEYVVIYLNTGLIHRVRNRLKRGDTWKSILSRIWGDFWAFKGVKKLADYEIKY